VNRQSVIWVAGHRGLVGSAVVRALRAQGYERLILRTRDDLDLRNATAVSRFIADERPEYVFLAAARVGGILANDRYPVEFLTENMAIELNVLAAAHDYGVRKLLFLGSSCIYPKHAPQPIREESLLTGPLEPTNEAYAIAKIAGIKLCEAYRRQYGDQFISAMPTNLYGPNDNFDLERGHVVPALIRKFDEAKRAGSEEVVVWGSGTPRREFLHVDDLADACVFLMREYDSERTINVGTGQDVSIAELAAMIASVVGYEGRIAYDRTMPDGVPRKLLDVTRLFSMGWKPRIELIAGLHDTYEWYRQARDRSEPHVAAAAARKSGVE
jgi:GDP-L-fucose synthase